MKTFTFAVSKPDNPIYGEVYRTEMEDHLMWDGNDWVLVSLEPSKYCKEELIAEFEKNPVLYNEVMLEMRNSKINDIIDE